MVPIMFDTTSAVALTTPSCLRREGLLGAATLLFYRARNSQIRHRWSRAAVIGFRGGPENRRSKVTLAQRRVVQDFETNQFPALKNQIEEAAGFPVPIEVNWDSLAVPGDEHNYIESWPQIYFEPLIGALKHLTRDDMGREAIKTGLKKIVIQNVKGCDYGDCWAALHDGC
jgi:hypothetical protein